jgi:hypothetical protein
MIITDLRYKDNAFIQYTQAMSGNKNSAYFHKQALLNRKEKQNVKNTKQI